MLVVAFIVFLWTAGLSVAGTPTADLNFGDRRHPWQIALEKKSRQYAQDLYKQAVRLAQTRSKEGIAIEDLKRSIANDPDFMPAWYALGRILYDNERYGEAERLLSVAQTRNNFSSQGAYLLGLAEYSLKDYRHARSSLKSALRRNDSDRDNWPRYVAQELLGRMALFDQQYVESIKWFTEVVAAQPKNWEYYYLRGLAFLRGNAYKNAAWDFRTATTLDPDNSALFNGLAWALMLEHEKIIFHSEPQFYKPALDAAKQAVKLGDDIPENYFLLGSIYEAQDQPYDAANAFREVVRMRPNDAFFRLKLAQTLLKLSDESADAEAEDHLIQGLVLDSDFQIKNVLTGQSKLLEVFLRHLLINLRIEEARALLQWARDRQGVETQ